MSRLVRQARACALAIVGAAGAYGVAACALTPRAGAGAADGAGDAAVATPDSARGVVLRSGNEPVEALVLLRAVGGPLALGGDAAPALRAVEGLEVTVRGRLTTERVPTAAPGGAPLFHASAFVVRASDGVAAHDGTVVAREGSYFLRLTDGGERPVPHLPAALRSQAGARVYLVGPLDRSPQAFGVITAVPRFAPRQH